MSEVIQGCEVFTNKINDLMATEVMGKHVFKHVDSGQCSVCGYFSTPMDGDEPDLHVDDAFSPTTDMNQCLDAVRHYFATKERSYHIEGDGHHDIVSIYHRDRKMVMVREESLSLAFCKVILEDMGIEFE